jgi:sterol desaturase/sphingolipid hydroxylase (fatty acid hydroxylase superfamily)
MTQAQSTPWIGLPYWQQAIIHWLRSIIVSRANYWAAYAVDWLCPIVLGYLGWQEATSWPIPVLSVVAGCFVFTLVEYAIHRWGFHSDASFMTPIHQEHHDIPLNRTALPFFTSPGASLILWSIFRPLLGQEIACFFLSGVLAGYFCYSLLHHIEHNVRVKRGLRRIPPFSWLQARWAAHVVHHRLSDKNYGVTTSFWDRVFGTHHRSTKTK